MKIYWITLRENVAVREWGVTATSEAEALSLLNQSSLLDAEVDAADVESCKEVRSIEDLDQRHVAPNMGLIVRRGIWYPNLNSA